MSEPGEDPGSRIFRSALPGWQSGIIQRSEETIELFAPGRGWLELAVGLSAFAILIPVLSVVAVIATLRARRLGNGRWLRVLLAAVWCAVLGSVVRTMLGLSLVP